MYTSITKTSIIFHIRKPPPQKITVRDLKAHYGCLKVKWSVNICCVAVVSSLFIDVMKGLHVTLLLISWCSVSVNCYNHSNCATATPDPRICTFHSFLL